MRHIKTLVFIKLLLLLWAMILAWFLIFVNKSPAPVEESTIIIMDVSSEASTQDIATSVPNDFITRLDAAKKIVTKIVTEFPQRSFGLITYGSEITYLIPATTDSGTLLQYVTSLLASDKNGNIEKLRNGNMMEWSTWLIAALQGKNIVVLWNVNLPKSLVPQANIIPLSSYKNPSILPSFHTSINKSHLSIWQTQRLVLLLCLLTILAL